MKRSPKLGVRTGAPSWSCLPHALSQSAHRQLKTALGFDPSDPEGTTKAAGALAGVEHWLGFYPGGVQALDNAPRPGDYVGVYAAIQKEAKKLLNRLTCLSEFYREKFVLEKERIGEGGLAAVERSIAQLFDATGSLSRRYKNQSSSGRPKGAALAYLITQLRSIFAHYACVRRINGRGEGQL